MMTLAHRRLAVAIVASVLLVAAAPLLGVIRSELRAAFPGQFSTIVNAIVAVAIGVPVVVALVRMREHRWRRYGALALALFGAAIYDHLTGSRDPGIRAVERMHIAQYGAITFLFYRVWRERSDVSSLAAPVVAAFIVGVAEEAFQWFLPARVGELRDVWLNSVAIGCGLLFSLGALPPAAFTAGWKTGSQPLVLRALALAVLSLAAFVQIVHLGVAIDDPDFGRFVSRYTVEELAALDRHRDAAWAAAPPVVRPPRFSREDQFMTEGIQHAQARNKAWAAGDLDAAWRENLILERHYPSVLKTPSYIARQSHVWPAEQRAQAERAAAESGQRAFVSDAYPYPVYLWSPLRLWVAAAALAAFLWWLGRVSGSPSSSPSSPRT